MHAGSATRITSCHWGRGERHELVAVSNDDGAELEGVRYDDGIGDVRAGVDIGVQSFRHLQQGH